MAKIISDRIIEEVIKNVLASTQAFCARSDNCENCPYMIKPAPGKSFATCALSGRPEYWRVEIFGGKAMSNKHRDHVERRYKSIMSALQHVIHYNLPDDFLDNFTLQLKVYGENFHPSLEPPTEENPVVWVLWQLIICMYGDYGVSPRAGWITDLNGALHFLEELKGRQSNE